MPYYVYVLLNPEGKTYVGHTNDLERRVAQHNDPDCRFTLHTKRHKGPWKLIHKEEYATRSTAVRRERQLKTGTGRQWIDTDAFRQSPPILHCASSPCSPLPVPCQGRLPGQWKGHHAAVHGIASFRINHISLAPVTGMKADLLVSAISTRPSWVSSRGIANS